MIKIAICEDNEKDKVYLTELINKYFDDLGVPYKISHFISGNDFLYSESYHDIIFLDVEMPEVDGFSVAKKLKECHSDTIVIITSSYDKYVLESFKVQPFRFIPKKMLDNLLFQALSDAIEEMKRKTDTSIVLNNKRNIRKVACDNIIYIYSEEKNVYFVMNNGEIIKDRNSLTKVLQELEKMRNYDFVLVSRTHICNLKYIVKMDKENLYTVSDEKISISRERVSEIRKMLMTYIKTVKGKRI